MQKIEKTISPNQGWKARLAELNQGTSLFLLVFPPNAFGSSQVKREDDHCPLWFTVNNW